MKQPPTYPLFVFYPLTAFSDQERETLLTNPQAGAWMAWDALDALLDIWQAKSGSRTLAADIRRKRERPTPNPKEDMRYWLQYITRYPRQWVEDEQERMAYDRATCLLGTVHFVAHGAIGYARPGLGLPEREQP